MQEVTNEVYLKCMRAAVMVVEGLKIKEVESSIMHFTEQEKRAILSQKLAKEIFDSLTNTDNLNKEEG